MTHDTKRRLEQHDRYNVCRFRDFQHNAIKTQKL